MTAQMPTQSNAATGETIQQEWWVQRWVDLLNTYRFKKRLERGRIYAREGNILHMEFQKGKVHARVQGTADEPYKLHISIERFTDEDWNFVVASMAEKAIYSAKLLAGEMPDDIETVFTSNGLSLFPFKLADVRSRCNCPDPQNPCKHIAAVYYQLGDFFREDPFVLFQLRGRSKSQILEAIRHQRSGITPSSDISLNSDTEEIAKNESEGESVSLALATEEKPSDPALSDAEATAKPNDSIFDASLQTPSTGDAKQSSDSSDIDVNNIDPQAFWQYNEPLDPSLVVITPPGSAQTVLDVLGKMPLAPNDAQTIRQYLDSVYQSVSQQAMITALSRNS